MSPQIPQDHSRLSVVEVLAAGAPPEKRLRPRHTTTLIVAEGIVYLVLEEDEQVLTPGDMATIAAGESHRFFNAGDDDARIVATYERVDAVAATDLAAASMG